MIYNFFQRLFARNKHLVDECIPSPVNSISKIRVGELRTNSISFQIYPARGGTVIETLQYDQKTDRHIPHLYVISEGEDFTQTLGQIVSMEQIRS